ncbi:MAG: pilus assembly protein [Alphaproteobacteria bacterium]|nr:pilus assembly protein [Alphaproteobacteria bacterium]
MTAIEFALLAAPLTFIILGAIEFSLFLFVQSSLEGATFAASRIGKTGYVEDTLTQEETIRGVIEDRLGFFLDMNQLSVEATSYADFSSIGQPEPFVDANGNGVHDLTERYTDSNGNGTYDTDMGVEGPGTAGEVVVYTVSYPWRILNPLFMTMMGGEEVDITSKFVVKNEPY